MGHGRKPPRLDGLATGLADPVLAGRQARERLIDGRHFGLRRIPDRLQCLIVLQLDCLIAGIGNQRLVAPGQIVVHAVPPQGELRPPRHQAGADRIEIQWCSTHRINPGIHDLLVFESTGVRSALDALTVSKGLAQAAQGISRVPLASPCGTLARSKKLQDRHTQLDDKPSTTAVQTPNSRLTERPDEQIAGLLEQLMQIARTSALEEMASGIAHELNQPIGAIATFAQAGQRMLTRSEPMVDAAADVLRHISGEALNAGEGIHRIRKLFNGREVARTQCTLADVIAEIRPVLEFLASRCSLVLNITIAADLPAVSIDRLRIQHVLFTLVQNALEAPRQPTGQAAVSIDVSGDRYGVVTSVVDHGMGIDGEARTNLFRPFFTTKRHGTGLGLASSRAIIEAHEGTIGFEDAAGGGARFWFRLPAASGAATT